MANKTQFPDITSRETATIAISGTKSASVALNGSITPVKIYTPSALDGSNISFEASYDNTTFTVLQDTSGADISIPMAVSKCISLDPAIFTGINYIKLVSDTTETAARSFILVTRPV